eukprot:3588414-Amphidinium_carterae.2
MAMELLRLFVRRGHRSHPAAKRMLVMLDKDGDNSISRDEIRQAVQEARLALHSRLQGHGVE